MKAHEDVGPPGSRARPPHHPRPTRRLAPYLRRAADRPRLAARFGAAIHTVTVTVPDLEIQRIRAKAAYALGTEHDDPRLHVEVYTDVAAAVHRSLGKAA